MILHACVRYAQLYEEYTSLLRQATGKAEAAPLPTPPKVRRVCVCVRIPHDATSHAKPKVDVCPYITQHEAFESGLPAITM